MALAKLYTLYFAAELSHCVSTLTGQTTGGLYGAEYDESVHPLFHPWVQPLCFKYTGGLDSFSCSTALTDWWWNGTPSISALSYATVFQLSLCAIRAVTSWAISTRLNCIISISVLMFYVSSFMGLFYMFTFFVLSIFRYIIYFGCGEWSLIWQLFCWTGTRRLTECDGTYFQFAWSTVFAMLTRLPRELKCLILSVFFPSISAQWAASGLWWHRSVQWPVIYI